MLEAYGVDPLSIAPKKPRIGGLKDRRKKSHTRETKYVNDEVVSESIDVLSDDDGIPDVPTNVVSSPGTDNFRNRRNGVGLLSSSRPVLDAFRSSHRLSN